jgi:iron(II)-dependent oxidoreductase
MSLNLTKPQIMERLKNKKFMIPISDLINQINKTRNLTINFLQPLINGEISGYEKNKLLGQTNPLLWEFGHMVYFWEHKTLRFLENDKTICNKLSLNNSENIYNSFVVLLEDRYTIKLYDAETVLKSYNRILNHIIKIINSKRFELNPTKFYFIWLGLLHNEMHNESYLFKQKMLGLEKPQNLMLSNCNDIFMKSNINNNMICIQAGSFMQGSDDDFQNFRFDNEMPSFNKYVNTFHISKYPITEGQYLDFIENGGYHNGSLWCKQGLVWVSKNNITKPIYWKYNKQNKKWMVKEWNAYRYIKYNYPMCHISWYEASAYCKFKNGRLPTESEWEYMTTISSDTEVGNKCNLDYKFGELVPVNAFDKNKDNVSQLYGNIWEWCQGPIYPYDGFTIDPVYREMSYPFFGFRKICKGGSWATPKFLINSKYRNAQLPDNRIQFIGFRIVKD